MRQNGGVFHSQLFQADAMDGTTVNGTHLRFVTVVPGGCDGWKSGAMIVIDTEGKPVAEQM